MTIIRPVTYQVIYTTHGGTNVFQTNVTALNLRDARVAMWDRIIHDVANGYVREDYRLNSLTVAGTELAAQAFDAANKMALHIAAINAA